MKKTFKTILACLAAATTAFTAVAFSACEDTDNNNGNEDNKQITDNTGNENTGNESTGNENTGNNGANENNDAVAKLLEKIDCDYAALSLEGTFTEQSREVTVKGKFNLDGNADIQAVASQSGKEEKEYSYTLMRDWSVYGVLGDKEITDFTAPDIYMYGIVDIVAKIEEGLAQSQVQIPFEIDARALLNGLMQADDLDEMLNLMHAAQAVSVTESTITIDFNRAVYNAANDIVSLINGLSATTTLGDILNNEKLNGYANALTGELDPEEVVEVINGLIAELKQSEQFPAEAAVFIDSVAELFTKVKPDENSTIYEYIVKVLSSQELVDKINALMGMPSGFGLAKKITQFTLGEILALAGQDASVLQQLKASAAQLLTGITEDSLTAEEVTVKNFVTVLNYDGEYNVTSLTVSAEIIEDSQTQTPQFTITFEKSAFTDLAVLPNPLPEMPKDEQLN